MYTARAQALSSMVCCMAFPPMLCDAKKTYAHIHYFILIALKFMEDLLDFFRAGGYNEK
jgi:hypothetical protein